MYGTPTFDFDATPEQRNMRGRLPGDEGLHVNFYKRAVENVAKSEAEGRKIFEEHEFIHIAVPGDQYNIIDTFATDKDKNRFPIEYKRFVDKTEALATGTPIEQMPTLSLREVAEFKALNIHTVEDLASLPDSTRITGIHEVKRKAKAFLDATHEEAIALKAEETSKALREKDLQLASHQAEIETLKAQMAEFMAAQKKKKTEE